MSDWLQKQWLTFTWWHLPLLPISWLFLLVVVVRKFLYKKGLLPSVRLAVPVIVVGNINVGGAGKTPLVIWLVEQLKLSGYKPGVISRGYGSDLVGVASVNADSHPSAVGDEPVLIAMHADCPVFVGAKRAEVGLALLKAHPECDIIISDDGLQHYALQRDVELVVFDSVKGFGNAALLPAGPLREPLSRLQTIDILVQNGESAELTRQLFNRFAVSIPFEMQLKVGSIYNLKNRQQTIEPVELMGKSLTAIAGIGNPERFFHQLTSMGLNFKSKAYNDHYPYTIQDFDNIESEIVLMTEKDAVKCKSFARSNFWVLPVKADINKQLLTNLFSKLNKLRN